MIKKTKFKSGFIIENKHIKYKYFIKQEFNAGIVLKGWEIKSFRKKKINIDNSYVVSIKGEIFLFGAFFQPLSKSNLYFFYNATRVRKLLLNKYEINLLINAIKFTGYTIVVLYIFLQKSFVKVRIGIAKGKNKIDKRVIIKKREWLINKNRIIC